MEHRGRELMNLVGMLTHCLRLPDLPDAERRQWPAKINDANRRLQALFDSGLSRDFVAQIAPPHQGARADYTSDAIQANAHPTQTRE